MGHDYLLRGRDGDEAAIGHVLGTGDLHGNERDRRGDRTSAGLAVGVEGVPHQTACHQHAEQDEQPVTVLLRVVRLAGVPVGVAVEMVGITGASVEVRLRDRLGPEVGTVDVGRRRPGGQQGRAEAADEHRQQSPWSRSAHVAPEAECARSDPVRPVLCF